MPANERTDASLEICALALRDPSFQRAQNIAVYLAADDEVNTWPLIERAWRMKKRVFAPVVEKKHHMRFRRITGDTPLARNRYGLLEPATGDFLEPRRFDVVYTPLVVFDSDNNRIGMGAGYFDRVFSFQRHTRRFKKPKLIGLAFDCQRVEHIDASPWDIPLFAVISERGAVVAASLAKPAAQDR